MAASIYGHVNVSRFSHLDENQKNFVAQIIPLARHIRNETVLKIRYEGRTVPTETGIFPSIIAAMCVVVSRFGTSPLSRPRVEETVPGTYIDCDYRTRRTGSDVIVPRLPHLPGYNYLHLRAGGRYCRYYDSIEINGILYKSFACPGDFAVAVSDMYSWRGHFNDVLEELYPETQLFKLSKRKRNPKAFFHKVKRTIESLELWRID